MLNWDILRNPYNWIIINLIVLIGGLSLKYLGISAETPYTDE